MLLPFFWQSVSTGFTFKTFSQPYYWCCTCGFSLFISWLVLSALCYFSSIAKLKFTCMSLSIIIPPYIRCGTKTTSPRGTNMRDLINPGQQEGNIRSTQTLDMRDRRFWMISCKTQFLHLYIEPENYQSNTRLFCLLSFSIPSPCVECADTFEQQHYSNTLVPSLVSFDECRSRPPDLAQFRLLLIATCATPLN